MLIEYYTIQPWHISRILTVPNFDLLAGKRQKVCLTFFSFFFLSANKAIKSEIILDDMPAFVLPSTVKFSWQIKVEIS